MKKALLVTSLFLTLGVFAVSSPVSVLAKNSNNNAANTNGNQTSQEHRFQSCADHPDQNKCQALSVPEFGMIPGVIAAVASAGSYLVLKKKTK